MLISPHWVRAPSRRCCSSSYKFTDRLWAGQCPACHIWVLKNNGSQISFGYLAAVVSVHSLEFSWCKSLFSWFSSYIMHTYFNVLTLILLSASHNFFFCFQSQTQHVSHTAQAFCYRLVAPAGESACRLVGPGPVYRPSTLSRLSDVDKDGQLKPRVSLMCRVIYTHPQV